jgi:hypothetical protein
MGTITVAAPAPRPEIILPIDSMAMETPRVRRIDPIAKQTAVKRMAKSRPRLEEIGPPASAPIKPPRVNMLDTTANWASFMGIQSGKAVEVVVATARFELEDDIQDMNALESLDETDDFGTWQEMTSCGAFSSA